MANLAEVVVCIGHASLRSKDSAVQHFVCSLFEQYQETHAGISGRYEGHFCEVLLRLYSISVAASIVRDIQFRFGRERDLVDMLRQLLEE